MDIWETPSVPFGGIMNDKRINKRNADPEILRAYEDMRNERRVSNYLLPMTLGGKGVFLLTFLILVLGFPATSGYVKAYVLIGVSGCYLLTCFTFMVIWSQSGKRLRTLGFIVGFLAFVVVVAGLWDWLMRSII
jgi:hypothetical protein